MSAPEAVRSRNAASGCGLVALAAFGLLSLVAVLVIGAGLFLVRSGDDDARPPVDEFDELVPAAYSIEVDGEDGRWFRLWSTPLDGCMGVTTINGDSAVCVEPGDPIIDKIPLEESFWLVSLIKVGVPVEPEDRNCLIEHSDTFDGFNMNWCRLS